ncbi:MAG: heme o synthase [Armatimonadota bacterium]|nr:heme o synthase [Armatimonadota bacterium]
MRPAVVRLLVANLIATFTLIVLGGVVRATGAGLACPDWPLCHGRLIPPLEPLVLVEWSHRLVASLVGVLTLAAVVVVWRDPSSRAVLGRPAVLAVLLLAVQVVLGGLTVRLLLSAWLVVAHLGAAMAFFAVLVVLAVTAFTLGPAAPPRDRFRWLAVATAVVAYGLVLAGGYVSATGAGLACPDWPLCYGQLLPALRGRVGPHLLHRFSAVVAGAMIVATAWVASRTQGRRPALQATSAVAVGLFVLQVLLGALNIEYELADAVTVSHLATAAALLGTLVALAVLAFRLPEGEVLPATAGTRPPARTRAQRVLDYVALTKPRIVVLLLVTALASMLIATPGRVSPWLVLLTLAGGALSAGAANALNQVLDRDIDALMSRTRSRPIPAGRVIPAYAVAFAVLLGAGAFVELAVLVNLPAAVLALAALLFYVGVYTVWLKRRTPHNIVIGGAAGAVPPLVGWAAAAGRIDLPAVLLFLIVFLWTPPHFWALALWRRDDYARAGVPMLPVVAGETSTHRQILAYTVLLVVCSLLLWALGYLGLLYALTALGLGGGFVALAARLVREKSTPAAVRVFGYSVVYLALLFAAMVADRFLTA